mgnify:CR=1 FL=1
MKSGIYTNEESQEVFKYLEENYSGEGFNQHLEKRLTDFIDLPEDEKVVINKLSLEKAKALSLLPIDVSGIFLLGNGNLRLLFENDNESLGIQILEDGFQIVHLEKNATPQYTLK